MDFFEQQELSRRSSRRLVAWFALAAAFTVASYCAAGALIIAFVNLYWTGTASLPWRLLAGIAALVGGVILAVSAYRLYRLREGGHAVAELLGARYMDPGRCNPAERRLLNVVEEMAIASGVPVPPVYVLLHEDAVNGLVAGHSPNEAVLIMTRGAVQKLSRDELQGVVGHEFSHILNGDMALNVRLAGLLAGLTSLGELGEALVAGAARQARGVPRDKQGGEAVAAVIGLAVAFIGFPGTLAATAIKAAVSRQREFLADAASVQFTRNPEGIAGALDSILALPAHTVVLAAHAEALSHMFFAPAVAHWWGFPTHPPIGERIYRVHPRFQRDDYRARRHGRRREVAVIDGGGNLVKHVRTDGLQLLASIGQPTAQHLSFGSQLLSRLPQRLREALHHPPQAELAMLTLGGFPGARTELEPYVGPLRGEHLLTLAELAVPAIKSQPQKARDAFVAEFAARAQADQRVTLREFMLLTYLRQRLREGAGQPIATRYRKVADVEADLALVLSLLARASGAPSAGQAPGVDALGAALERLRHLAPFEKPRVLKACVEAAQADGRINFAEAELVRMVAATLDCPVPPVLAQSR
ncbi:MAG TPA: M48 family metalloprotease [Burkholderiales bacterium]|nr:M48 family metalloprotease [Burkholderiales bacterium]